MMIGKLECVCSGFQGAGWECGVWREGIGVWHWGWGQREGGD